MSGEGEEEENFICFATHSLTLSIVRQENIAPRIRLRKQISLIVLCGFLSLSAGNNLMLYSSVRLDTSSPKFTGIVLSAGCNLSSHSSQLFFFLLSCLACSTMPTGRSCPAHPITQLIYWWGSPFFSKRELEQELAYHEGSSLYIDASLIISTTFWWWWMTGKKRKIYIYFFLVRGWFVIPHADEAFKQQK